MESAGRSFVEYLTHREGSGRRCGKDRGTTLPSISKRDGPLDHPVAFTSVIRILINDVSFAPSCQTRLNAPPSQGYPKVKSR